MKKYIFGFLLIGTFASYVAYVQLNGGLEQKPSIVVVGNLNTTTTSPSPVSAYVPPPKFDNKEDGGYIPTTPTPTPTPTPIPTPTVPTMMQTPMPMRGRIYRDGSFTGPVVDAYYGNVQVKAIITNGKITDVQFLDHPQDRGRSIQINNYAMPLLTQEAIQAQSANVNVVSGASATSGAFQTSLASALAQAKI